MTNAQNMKSEYLESRQSPQHRSLLVELIRFLIEDIESPVDKREFAIAFDSKLQERANSVHRNNDLDITRSLSPLPILEMIGLVSQVDGKPGEIQFDKNVLTQLLVGKK